MSGITRLSECKTVNDFKVFAAMLKSDDQSSGRSFTYIEDGKTVRAYTMNQIVHRFSTCVKDSKKNLGKPINDATWKNKRQIFRSDISDALNTINGLNKSADQVEERSMLGMRKALGNAWYAITHWGFNKEKALEKIQKNYPDILESITNVTQKILDDFYGADYDDAFIHACEKLYARKGCLLSDALERPESQAIIFKNEKFTQVFQIFAGINHIDNFTKANLDHASQEISNSAQKYVDLGRTASGLAAVMEIKLTKVGLVFKDALLNPNLFSNDQLRPGLVAYAQQNNHQAVLDHHLNFVVQKIVNNADNMVRQSNGSARSLAESLESAFESKGISFPNFFRPFFNLSSLSNPYNIQHNDSRLHSLFFDNRFNDALIEFANRHTGISRILVLKDYQKMYAELIVKDANSLIRQANGSLEDLANAIMAKMESFTPKDIVLDSTLLNDDRLRPALRYYANQHQIEGFSDRYQDFINQRIVTQKAQYQTKYRNKKASSVAKDLDRLLRKEGFSLEGIITKPSPLSYGFSSYSLIGDDFFRPYLVAYAKEHRFDEFLNRHLSFVVEEMVSFSCNLLRFTYSNTDIIENIKARLKREKRTINELFENDSLINALANADRRIKEALDDYRNHNTAIRSSEISQTDFVDQRKKTAIQLAITHKEAGTNLIDRFNLRVTYRAGNNAALKKAVMLLIRNNHSDKNAESNNDLVTSATSLLDLINQGNLDAYDHAFRNPWLAAFNF